MNRMKVFIFSLVFVCLHTLTRAADGDYNYDNQGADWYDLGLCPDRNRQSPCTLPSCANLPFAPYGVATYRLEQRMVTKIEPLEEGSDAYVVKPNIRLKFEDRQLESYAFHFHSKAEHVWDNIHPELEFHWIFADPNGGDYVVLGVGFVLGHRTDPTILKVIDIMEGYYFDNPMRNQPQLSLTRYARPRTMLKHYDGSLTTPGCDEIVQWIVRDKLLTITKIDLKRIRMIILDNDKDNYRVVQDAYNHSPVYKIVAQKYTSSSGMSLFDVMDGYDEPNRRR